MASVLRQIVGAGLALLILGFAANLVVDNPYSHRLLRGVADSALSEKTNLSVTFSGMKLTALPPELTLYGVQIFDREQPGIPLAEAARIRARVSIWSIIWGNPRLALLELADLSLDFSPNSAWANMKTFPSSDPTGASTLLHWPPKIDLPVDHLVIQHSRINFETKFGAADDDVFHLRLRSLNIDMIYHSWSDMRTKIDLHDAEIGVFKRAVISSLNLSTQLKLAGRDFVASDLILTEKDTVDLRGSLIISLMGEALGSSVTGIDIATDLTGKANLSILGKLLDVGETDGVVEARSQAQVRIPVSSEKSTKLIIKSEASVTDGRLGGFSLMDTATTVTVTPEAISFDKIRIRDDDEEYGEGEGILYFDSPLNFKFTSSLMGIRLTKLIKTLRGDFDAFDLTLLSHKIAVAGKGFPFHLRVDAVAGAAELTPPPADFKRDMFPQSPACILDVHLDINDDRLDFTDTKGSCFAGVDLTRYSMRRAVDDLPQGASSVSPLSLKGIIPFSDKNLLNMTVESNALNMTLGPYFAQKPMSGVLNARAKIYEKKSGVVVVDIAATGQNIELDGIPFGKIAGHVSIFEESIQWRNFTAELAPGAFLTAKEGSLGIGSDWPITTDVQAERVPPIFMAKFLAAVTGTESASFAVERLNGRFSGPLFQPLRYRGDARIDIQGVTVGTEPYAERVAVHWNANQERWLLSEIAVGSRGIQCTGEVERQLRTSQPQVNAPAGASGAGGMVAELGGSTDDKYRIRAACQPPPGFKGSNLASLPFLRDAARAAHFEGALGVEANLQGPLHSLSGTFKADVMRPKFLGSSLPAVDLHGILRDDKANIFINAGGNILNSRLEIDFAKAGLPYQLFSSFQSLDIRFVAPEIFYGSPRNFAYIAGDLEARGELLDWWNSTGRLNLRESRIKYVRDVDGSARELVVGLDRPVALVMEKGAWRFADKKNLLLIGEGMRLDLDMGQTALPSHLDITIKSRFDVSVLKDFLPQVESATGAVAAVARVRGALTDPDLSVEIDDVKPDAFTMGKWQPLAIGIADMRPAFRNMQAHIVYENGLLKIQRFEADKGSGKVSVSGSAGMSDDQPETKVEITLRGAELQYAIPVFRRIDAQLDGQLTLSGSGKPFLLSGDIRVAKAVSVYDFDIRKEILGVTGQAPSKDVIADPTPGFLNLEIDITADQTISVTNRNVQAAISTDLQVRGSERSPRLGGNVDINRGTFFYNQTFTINRCVLTFDDPLRPDPTLDIQAAADVSQHRVLVAVTGKASNPIVDLTVDPPTREDGSVIDRVEILVLLSRGSLPEARNRDTQSAAQSEALNLLAGQIEQPLEKLLDATGQRVVHSPRVSTIQSDTGKTLVRGEATISLNQLFGSRDILDLTLAFDEEKQLIKTDYPVHDNINLSVSAGFEKSAVGEADTETKGSPDTGMDLRFRFPLP